MKTQNFASARKGKDASLYSEEAVYSFTSYLQRFPDLDEVLTRAGLNRSHLRVLEVDDEVAQCVDTRREALIATPWRLEPQQSRLSKRLTATIEPHIESILRSAFDAVLYGYSVQEVVYTRTGDGIGIASVAEKPLEWFYLSPAGNLIYRSATDGDIECDPRKYLLTRRQPSYRQPYGESLLSRLYWTVFFKGHGRKFWAKFLERHGEPVLVGKVADQAKFIADVAALGLAAGLPVQPTDAIESISVSQSGEFERYDNVLSRSIQKLILGQTLTSDVGSSGSFAAAKVHDSVRMDKRNADIRLVSQTAQRLVDTLCAINGWQTVKFTMADDTGLEMERAQRDALLTEKRVLKLSKDYLLDKYDFVEGDFDIVEEPAAVAPAPTIPEAGTELTASLQTFAPSDPFTAGQMVIERGIDATLADLRAPISGKELQSVILAAESPEDLEDRLAVVLRDADRTTFNRVYERALFAADAIGFAHAGGGRPAQEPVIPPAMHFHMPANFGAPSAVTVQMAAPAAPNFQVDVHIAEQPAPIINVQPSEVTLEAVIYAQAGETQIVVQHPTQAVQTVERDEKTQEILRTVTKYEGFDE